MWARSTPLPPPRSDNLYDKDPASQKEDVLTQNIAFFPF